MWSEKHGPSDHDKAWEEAIMKAAERLRDEIDKEILKQVKDGALYYRVHHGSKGKSL